MRIMIFVFFVHLELIKILNKKDIIVYRKFKKSLVFGRRNKIREDKMRLRDMELKK